MPCNWHGDCASQFCNPTEKKCAYSTPNSAIKPPFSCESDNECVSATYKNYAGDETTIIIDGACACGLSQIGNAYCLEFPGDEDYRQATAALQEWIAKPQMVLCNPVRKWSVECMKTYMPHDTFEEYMYYFARINNLANVMDLDKCSAEMYQKEYQEAYDYLFDDNDEDDSDDDFALLLSVFIFALI